MGEWSLVYDGFDPSQERLREALCTLGNGYFATRGAAPENAADDVHYPGTYLAGGFNRLETEIAGRTVENEDLVNMPNWLVLRFRPAQGRWFDTATDGLLEYRQELDMRNGVLVRHLRFADDEGRRTRVTQRRFVHMDNMHLAGLQTTFVAENWSGELQVHSGLDGRVVNAGVERYRQLNGQHLRVLEQSSVEGEAIYLRAHTVQSRLRVALAARTRVLEDVEAARELVEEDGYIAEELVVPVVEGQPVTIDKVVALFTSRDPAISEAGLASRTLIRRADGIDELLRSHVLAWERLWRRFDIELDSDERTRMILRLHVFHLLQTVSMNTVHLDVGVPARGLHGEAYRGHIFWDEMFIFPVLNLRLPVVTKALLEYRRRRMGEALWAAQQAGYEGAMYPWQSGSDGREESQQLHLNPRSGRWLPDNSHLQKHVNLAVAYNIWHYYQVTGDHDFLRFRGGDMYIQVARFLASLTSYSHAYDRYEICGVMGPDEYHDAYPDADEPGLCNNSYTNVMTVWVLERAVEIFRVLAPYQRAELAEAVELRADELDHWEDITRKMRIVFHDGVISQFEDYAQLAEFDWDAYRARYGDIQRLDRILEAEGDSTNRYKLSKQADVLMLFYLLSVSELSELLAKLGYAFDEHVMQRTIDYYQARTSHGSTLSNVVQSWVLAKSDRARSWHFFKQALESDISDVQGGTTAEGIHLGAMAGSVDLLQRCYAGLETRDDVLWFDPVLPKEAGRVAFNLHFRGHHLRVVLSASDLQISSALTSAPPMQLGFRGTVTDLHPGSDVSFALD